MEEEQVVNQQETSRWSIDFEWYKQNNRSFPVLARNYLCSRCLKQKWGPEIPVARILSTIKDCCSSDPNFVTHKLPIMDAVFRIFLANGNQAITVDELRKELVERLRGDTYRTSPEILLRLLRNDNHYGIREVKS